jgi:hypothetical protein
LESGGGSSRRSVRVGVIGFKEIVSEKTACVLIAGGIGLPLLHGVVDRCTGGWSVPGCAPSIVVYIVGPAKGIDAAFPARRERAVLISMGIKVIIGRGRGGHCDVGCLREGRGSNANVGRAGWRGNGRRRLCLGFDV